MVGNDPVNRVDYLGLATEYDSSDEAARVALTLAKELTRQSDDKSKARQNPIVSRQKDKFPRGKLGNEYGGLICAKKSCEVKYIFTGPISGDTGVVNPDKAPCPEGWFKTGEYHTHPGGGQPPQPDLTRSNVPNKDGSKQKNYVGDGREGGGDDYVYGPGEPGPGGVPSYIINSFR
ncbi:hypothetical protein HNQ64_000037 [Prosthecobacter dejongeii]|uniref:DUF4329 domain-containing protein n=2 Tax=Prosthecobacter dejongeii TaxID=48465 RepID=A0A7W7YGN4_9BACT|nr:hypothetical protein [Prosthecobacter dejongeii]